MFVIQLSFTTNCLTFEFITMNDNTCEICNLKNCNSIRVLLIDKFGSRSNLRNLNHKKFCNINGEFYYYINRKNVSKYRKLSGYCKKKVINFPDFDHDITKIQRFFSKSIDIQEYYNYLTDGLSYHFEYYCKICLNLDYERIKLRKINLHHENIRLLEIFTKNFKNTEKNYFEQPIYFKKYFNIDFSDEEIDENETNTSYEADGTLKNLQTRWSSKRLYKRKISATSSTEITLKGQSITENRNISSSEVISTETENFLKVEKIQCSDLLNNRGGFSSNQFYSKKIDEILTRSKSRRQLEIRSPVLTLLTNNADMTRITQKSGIESADCKQTPIKYFSRIFLCHNDYKFLFYACKNVCEIFCTLFMDIN